MTTEEKLQHFQEVCMEDARERFRQITGEYEKGLRSTFEEHKTDALRRQEMRLSIETEKIEREAKRELSMEQLHMKREISKEQDAYKDKLFAEVKELLSEYRKTASYKALIEKQIAEIRKLAGEKDCEIYLDASDSGLFDKLPAGVSISEESFLGGTMAVIPSINIFVDNSFRTRLEKEKHEFSFITGEQDEQ
ncbi:MAG: V-type ATP synthase subunit E [Eubacteriales bacterium]|nr:V-type ATP synthase subunit E [Eubacteriales bacterium]